MPPIRSVLLAFVLAGPAVVPVPAHAAKAALVEHCTTLADCERRMRALAADDDMTGHLADAEMELVGDLARRPDAVPRLVELLADSDEHVATYAAAALARGEGALDGRWLPAIRAGLERKLDWLAPALARFPGDEAPRLAVATFLVSESAPDNPEGFALQLLGARALPAILAAARCPAGCGREDHYLLGQALHEFDDAGVAAAPELLAIAADPATAGDVAGGVVGMIGAIGPPARALAPELVALRDAKPELGADIDDALIELRVAEAAPVVAARLRESPDTRQLEDLADFAAAGHAAGPAVLELLTGDGATRPTHPWGGDVLDLRVAAARTLGAIGYRDAIPALQQALQEPRDVRLAWAAAGALGQLRAEAAIPALDAQARTHWYPPVRAAATQALASIRAGAPAAAAAATEDEDILSFDLYTEIPDRVERCAATTLTRLADAPGELDAADAAEEAQLQALAFDAVVLSYDAGDAAEQLAAAEAAGEETPVIDVNPTNLREIRTPVREVPTVALRLDDGWLAASNRGEFGGELMFLADDGAAPVQVYDGNVSDLYRFGTRLVALVGIAHLAIDEGRVLELRRDGDGWRTDVWRVLPSAPGHSWRVDTGELLINTYDGTLLLAADGSLRMAPCAGAD